MKKCPTCKHYDHMEAMFDPNGWCNYMTNCIYSPISNKGEDKFEHIPPIKGDKK